MNYNFKINNQVNMILCNTNTFQNKNNNLQTHLLNTFQPNNNSNWNNLDINYNEIILEDNIQVLNNKLKKIETKGRRYLRGQKENKFNKIIEENNIKFEGTMTTKDSKNTEFNNSKYSKFNKEISIKKIDIINNKFIYDKEKEIEEINDKLIICMEGCNRKFLPNALEKHIKICKKVFTNEKKYQKNNKNKDCKKNKKNWKKDSENFRNILKQIKQPELPKNDEEFDLSD